MVAHLDPAVENPPDCRARRGDGSAAVQQLVAKVGDPRPNAARTATCPGRPRAPRSRRTTASNDVEIRVGDVVDEAVDELSGRGILLGGRVERRDVERLAAVARRLPHRDEELGVATRSISR